MARMSGHGQAYPSFFVELTGSPDTAAALHKGVLQRKLAMTPWHQGKTSLDHRLCCRKVSVILGPHYGGTPLMRLLRKLASFCKCFGRHANPNVLSRLGLLNEIDRCTRSSGQCATAVEHVNAPPRDLLVFVNLTMSASYISCRFSRIHSYWEDSGDGWAHLAVSFSKHW